VYAGFDVATGATCLANLNYGLGESATGLIFIPGDFLYEFMKIDGGGFYDVRGNVNNDGMVRADPSPEAASLGFPVLEIDRTIYTPSGPLPFCNSMYTPTFDNTGGLDTLYTYVAGRSTSSMNRKPTSFRYFPTDPVPTQGPVAVFGFPLHFLQIGSASEGTGVHGLGKKMIDWLLANQGLSAAARRTYSPDPGSSR
jgi:hypothetical protein